MTHQVVPQDTFGLGQYRGVAAQLADVGPVREQLFKLAAGTDFTLLGKHNRVELLDRPGRRHQLIGVGFQGRQGYFGGQCIPAQQQGAAVLLEAHKGLHMLPVLIALRLAAQHHNGVQQLFLRALANQAGQAERASPFGQVIDSSHHLGLRMQLERQAYRSGHKGLAPGQRLFDLALEAGEQRQHISVAATHQARLHGRGPAVGRGVDLRAQGLQLAQMLDQRLGLLQGPGAVIQQTRHFASAFLELQLAFLSQILMHLNQCLRVREVGQLRQFLAQIGQRFLEFKPGFAQGDDVLQGEARAMLFTHADQVGKIADFGLRRRHLQGRMGGAQALTVDLQVRKITLGPMGDLTINTGHLPMKGVDFVVNLANFALIQRSIDALYFG